MFFESGVQVTTMLFGPRRNGGSTVTSDMNVSRRTGPPAAGIT